MLQDYFHAFVLGIIGVITPTIVAALLRVMPSVPCNPKPATVRITMVSSAVSLFVTLFFIFVYDYGYLPLTKQVSVRLFSVANGTMKRQFGIAFPNDTRGTMLVTVSAFNNGPGFTMCAAIETGAENFSQSKPGNCANENTVAAASFDANAHHAAITFIVPRGFSYMSLLTVGT